MRAPIVGSLCWPIVDRWFKLKKKCFFFFVFHHSFTVIASRKNWNLRCTGKICFISLFTVDDFFFLLFCLVPLFALSLYHSLNISVFIYHSRHFLIFECFNFGIAEHDTHRFIRKNEWHFVCQLSLRFVRIAYGTIASIDKPTKPNRLLNYEL